MDEIEFHENVREWCSKNYPSVTEAIISNISTVFTQLYHDLEIKKIRSSVSDIQEIVKDDPSKLEKAFYSTFVKLREKKTNGTILTIASIARKALEIMGMNKKRLRIPPRESTKVIDNSLEKILPLQLRNLPEDAKIREFVTERFEYSKKNLHCKSLHAQKIMLRYWTKILEQFGKLEELDMNTIDLSIKNIVKITKPIIVNSYYIIYLHHLFVGINDDWNVKIKDIKSHFEIIEKKKDDDGDKDVLTPKQQENIWKSCETNLEKLLISLLFTTGMRVGGLCNIKIIDVYDKTNNTIRDYGSTLEKRGKTRRFPIFDMVKKPLAEWIEENHMIDTIYLFPNARDPKKPKSTMTFQTMFKDIAKRAGYEGEEVHIHSARHSVARNLLEAGNTMDDIGKYLGHANPATTAKFYANLSTKETVDRMNTECIGGQNNKKTHMPHIPNFDYEGKTKDKDKKKKKNKLHKLANIDIGGKSLNEEKLLKALEKVRESKK